MRTGKKRSDPEVPTTTTAELALFGDDKIESMTWRKSNTIE